MLPTKIFDYLTDQAPIVVISILALSVCGLAMVVVILALQ